MPHALQDYRDAIDALIGPIEEIMSKVNATLPGDGPHERSYLKAFVNGGLEQALELLTDAVADIDGFEEEPDEPDEPEVAEPDEEDEDADA